MSIALQLTSYAKLRMEGGVIQNRCAAACKGEAAMANYCMKDDENVTIGLLNVVDLDVRGSFRFVRLKLYADG